MSTTVPPNPKKKSLCQSCFHEFACDGNHGIVYTCAQFSPGDIEAQPTQPKKESPK
jgi:hypothetical protein